MVALAMLSLGAYAEIEEITVVGAKIYNGYADPVYDNNLLESIDYTKRYVAGGLGGFHGLQLNGTDTNIPQYTKMVCLSMTPVLGGTILVQTYQHIKT